MNNILNKITLIRNNRILNRALNERKGNLNLLIEKIGVIRNGIRLEPS